MGTTHIVVDGSNIATEGRSLPSLEQLLEAVDAVTKDKKPKTVTVIVDATFGHRIDESERKDYDARVSNGEIITPPAGVIGRGDAFILEVADRADAVVLSNDSFQEFHGDYTWLFDEGRLLGGKHVPGVGWIFLDRSPVRGAVSRKATSAAKRKRKEASSSKKGSKGPDNQAKATSRKGPTSAKKASKKATAKPSSSSSPKSGKEPEPYNELMPFLDFVGANEVGSVVEGEVEQFASHGAYVMVGQTRCYVPLKAMGDPAPRSARDVLTQGETRSFRVEAIDTPRRGIDLSLVDAGSPPSPASTAALATEAPPAVTEADLDNPDLSVSQRRKLRAALAAQADASARDAMPAESQSSPGAAGAATTRKAAAKRSTAKKAAPKKSAAKKSTAKKSATKKSTTKKSTARKSAAKKATKTTAKKAAAKKSTARKSAAKKSTTKKSTAKKTAAKKSAAKKSAAKKSAVKKSTAKKSTRKPD